MSTVRIKFQKTGLSIFFSHLDLQKVMQRALKMSGLPVWYSKGFNPHIYMTFTLPLSLGHESLCESFDFRLEEDLTEQQILEAMEGTLPDGIILTAAGAPDYDASQIKYALYKIKMYGDKSILNDCINDYQTSSEIVVTKVSKKKTTEINIKEQIKGGRFQKAKGMLTKPCAGTITTEYGQMISKGVTSKANTNDILAHNVSIPPANIVLKGPILSNKNPPTIDPTNEHIENNDPIVPVLT